MVLLDWEKTFDKVDREGMMIAQRAIFFILIKPCHKITLLIIETRRITNSKYNIKNSKKLTKEFLQINEIDHVIYAGELGDWKEHYQNAIDMDIMISIPYGKNNVSTTSIINKIKSK